MSDPAERRIYDLKWAGIRQRKAAEEESEKRQTEASRNERNRAAEEKVRKQKEEASLREQLQDLERQRSEYETKIFECSRAIRNSSATLKRLQERDDEDIRKESERNSWWTFFTSPIYGKQVPETEEQKQQREYHRLQRVHSKSIREQNLIQEEAKVHNLRDRLQDVTSKIAVLKRKREEARLADEARVQERLRREQEAKRRAEAQAQEAKRRAEAQAEYERQAKWKAEWEAELARRRKEEAVKLAARKAKEAQEAEETQRRARVAREAREAQVKKMMAQERAAQAARRTKAQGPSPPDFSSTPNSCRHKAFWPKIEGATRCQNCNTVQKRFAFECPGCNMIACAACRQTLRGERRRQNTGSNNVDIKYAEMEYDYWD